MREVLIKSTTGVPGENGKNFLIKFTVDGEQHQQLAERDSGSKFRIESYRGTLKDIKAELVRIWSEPDQQVDQDDSQEGVRGTWDCCDPCAIIGWLLLNPGTGQKGIEGIVKATLDNYGWLDHHGEVDSSLVRREIGVWLSTGN